MRRKNIWCPLLTSGVIKLGFPKYQAILTGLSRKGSPASGYPASCQDVRDQLRIIKTIPTGSGACFYSHIVDRDSLSGYGTITSTNRHVRLPAAGRDPHAWWCVEGRLNTVLYPIMQINFLNYR